MTFDAWLRGFPWLFQRDLPCVISADLDGIACGLLQQETLGWRVIGTYDGSAFCLWEQPNSVVWDDVVFLDVEILRPRARSLGNHLFVLDEDDVARLRRETAQCANPNLWRGINVRDSFQRKYPFSTLPLLLAARVLDDSDFQVTRAWIALSLHTDSSFTNAATYQANALDWLRVMGEDVPDSLKRFCRVLERLPAQTAILMLHQVQEWAAAASFGAKQRACRFDPRNDTRRERAKHLMDRLRSETSCQTLLPLDRAPVYSETFTTELLPLHTKGRQVTSFVRARSVRAVSMAATGRSEEGLSITLPNQNSATDLFR